MSRLAFRDRDGIHVELLTSHADLEAVADLEARCFSNPWSREMLTRELATSPAARVFVLRLPEVAVAAFCACWIFTDELHVNTLAVDAAFRRRGLATHLMRSVLQAAADAGVSRATLEVRESNEAARRLYEGLGFRVAARRPRYYTEPEEDALILWHDAVPEAARRSG